MPIQIGSTCVCAIVTPIHTYMNSVENRFLVSKKLCEAKLVPLQSRLQLKIVVPKSILLAHVLALALAKFCLGEGHSTVLT